MKIKLILATSIISLSSFSQIDFNDYKPLESKGSIPQDFYALSSEKVSSETEGKDDVNKDFITQSRFGIDELLHNGRVTFGDDLSKYIRKVAKIVLKNDQSLYNELRFYTLKSRITNAFSTDQGIIFVTTGLLSQLENEAQLAVILAHEISHYTEDHVHESFLESKQINNQDGFLDNDEKLIKLSSYSKEKEYEADLKGAELYLKSGYDSQELINAFNILLYSYLPFDEVPFDHNFFNSEQMKIPSIYFTDSTTAIKAIEDNDDSKSSHPNVKSRRKKIEEFIEDKNKGGKSNQTSRKEFLNIRTISRFETVRMSLLQREYDRCIYEVYLLKKEYPNSLYLDLSLSKAMYGLASYKSKNKLRKVTEKLSKVEGEQYQVNFFLKELSKEQMSIVALRTTQDLYLKHYPNKDFKNYRDWTLKMIIERDKINFNDYSKISLEEHLSSLKDTTNSQPITDSTIVETTTKPSSKYDRINAKKNVTSTGNINLEANSNPDEVFHLFSIYDLINDQKFIDLKEKISNEVADEKEEEDNTNYVTYKEARKNGAQMGIPNVLVFDPIIQFTHHRKGATKGYEESEKRKLEYIEDIKEYAEEIGIKTSVLDSKNLSKDDVGKFNSLGLIKEWFMEVGANDQLKLKSVLEGELSKIRKEFSFDYIFIPFIESQQIIKTLYIGPFGGIPTKSRKVLTQVGGIVLDAKKGTIHYTFDHVSKGKPKYHEISAHLYDMLLQIKTKRKREVKKKK
jgi:hypothetical protein